MTVFGRVAPTLNVRDMSSALDFWTTKLGFSVSFTNGSPVSFAIVQRGAAEVHLQVKGERAGQGHCHMLVTGIEELHRAFESSGVDIRQPLKIQPWGLRDIVIADIDGNTMEIAELISAPAPAL